MEKNYILGVDKAGQSSLLGPIVYICVVWEEGKSDRYKREYGLIEARKTSENRRLNMFDSMVENAEIHLFKQEMSAECIGKEMLRRNKTNLEELMFFAVLSLIDKAKKRFKIKHCYTDTLGSTQKYKEKLKNCFQDIDFTIKSKADSIHPIFSAASVFARVVRDKIMSEWKFAEDFANLKLREFGSGGSADPKTTNWLESNFNILFGFPSIVRFSWSTTQKYIKENGGVQMIWEDYTDKEQKLCTVVEPTENEFQDEFNVKLSNINI